MTRGLDDFRFHEISDRLYHFIWGDFADWYLELAKVRLGKGDDLSCQAARSTLVTVTGWNLAITSPDNAVRDI